MPASKLSSSQLAELIISSYKKLPLVTGGFKDELVDLIEQGKVENLAYWLQFHSFVRYQLRKTLMQRGDVNVHAPSVEIAKQVNEVLERYLEQQKIKQTLPKYITEDFTTTDYLPLSGELERTLLRLRDGQKITRQEIAPFIKAKNRRNEFLARSLDIVPISCAEYASESTLRKLVKGIAGLGKGERKQFFYYHLNEEHAIGFDVERDEDGKLKIFCFESASDPRHLETVDLLYKKLSSMGLDFEFKSCVSDIQKDSYNCAIYTLAALNEFGKYAHAFDYLPEQYEEDKDIGKTRAVKIPQGGAMMMKARHVQLDVLDKISWVRISDMPTKIIAMSQSHQAMEKALKESKDFDLDPATFVTMHKQKYHYEESKRESTKYINRRRENIREHAAAAGKVILEKAYSKYVQDLPLLAKIDKGEEVNFHQEISKNDSLTWDEKVQYIEKLFISITKRAGISKYLWNDPLDKISLMQFKSLLLLRNEYLYLLSQKSFEEIQEYFDDRNESSPLHYRLELWANRRTDLNVEPLQKVFVRCFKMDDVVLFYKKAHYYNVSDLEIKNPLVALFHNSTNVDANDVIRKLEGLENQYRGTSGESLYDGSKKLALIDEQLKSLEVSEKRVSFILAASSLDNETLLKSVHADEAYVLLDNGKALYYINKKNEKSPIVPIPFTESAFKKLQEVDWGEFESREQDEEEPHKRFSLSEGENSKPITEIMSYKQLNFLTSLVNHTPYTSEEQQKFQAQSVLKEAYIILLAELFAVDKWKALSIINHHPRLFSDELEVVARNLKAMNQIIAKFWSEDMLFAVHLVCRECPSSIPNPFSKRIDRQESLSAQEILSRLSDTEKSYSGEEETAVTTNNKIKFLLSLSDYVVSANLANKKLEVAYLQQISMAYIELLNSDNCGYQSIEEDHIPAQYVLYPLLGSKKQESMTIENILKKLNKCGNLFMKLKLLDVAFATVINAQELYTDKMGKHYSPQQLSDLRILQSAYLDLIKTEPYDDKDSDFNNKLKSKVSDSVYSGFLSENKTLQGLLIGKGRPSSPKTKSSVTNKTMVETPQSPVIQGGVSYTFFRIVGKAFDLFNTQSSEQTKTVEQKDLFNTQSSKQTKIVEQKADTLEQVVVDYYRNPPRDRNYTSLRRYHTLEYQDFNFRLERFHFSDSFAELTQWIAYERCKPVVPQIDEFDWKLNLAIHKEDLEKAFPIIATFANKFNLGTFKMMSQTQAEHLHKSQDKKMVGREVVIYCNANPEYDEVKWVAMISELEEALKKAGIRTSEDACPETKACPVSNRRLGKYTSYTHGAWTVKRMDVPFDEGIKETALVDEDLFAHYEYDASHECPAPKVAVVTSANLT